MKSILQKLSILLCVGLASAAVAKSKYKARKYNATFDEITVVPVAPEASMVGAYDGLYYSWDYSSNTVPGVGIQPHSPNNTAGFGIATDFTGYITTTYKGSKVAYFDFAELYAGCALAGASSGGVVVPVSCTITLEGYRTGSLKPVTTTLTYTVPAGALSAELQRFKLPANFKNLLNVTFTTPALPPSSFSGDNLIYTTYNKTK